MTRITSNWSQPRCSTSLRVVGKNILTGLCHTGAGASSDAGAKGSDSGTVTPSARLGVAKTEEAERERTLLRGKCPGPEPTGKEFVVRSVAEEGLRRQAGQDRRTLEARRAGVRPLPCALRARDRGVRSRPHSGDVDPCGVQLLTSL